MAANNNTNIELKEEEEEMKQKEIACVSVFFEDCTRHWFAIESCIESDSESVPGHEITEMKEDYGTRLDTTVGLRIVVLDSKIYHLGGHYRDIMTNEDSNKVHIFDTITGCWSEGPSLNQARAWFTFAGVIGRKIYVFGSRFGVCTYRNISVENWGECYDLDSQLQQWKTISAPTDLRPDFLSCHTTAAVVYGDQILFWGDEIGIYTYNPRFKLWSFIHDDFVNGGPRPCFNFIYNHVVIGDFAVWQFYGKIYAWDLTNHHTYLIWTLPGQWFYPSDWDEPEPCLGPSNLLHVGNGTLCFLRWRLYVDKPNIICYRFKIKGSKRLCGATGHVEIDPIGTQFYDVPGVGLGIHNAFTLSASCFGGALKE